MRQVSFAPDSFQEGNWSLKQWNVLNGLKVNGAGNGFFEYTIPWPDGVKKQDLESVSLVFEASAKELFGKDMEDPKTEEGETDYVRGGGTYDPCKGQNAYAMTDTKKHPSLVRVSVNNVSCGDTYLPDDPADHRGVLSWFSQPRNKTLSEAGSYGYLIETMIPNEILIEGQAIIIRMEVPEGVNGGLAIYGKDFGRYPLDPTLVFTKK